MTGLRGRTWSMENRLHRYPAGCHGPAMAPAPAEAEEKQEEESRKNISKVLIWIIAVPVFLIFITVVLAAIIAGFVFGMAGNGISFLCCGSYCFRRLMQATIIVTYQGGQDAAELTSLEVAVNDRKVMTWDSPATGDQKVFHEGTTWQGSCPCYGSVQTWRKPGCPRYLHLIFLILLLIACPHSRSS